jgi:multiple sugar transport system permease protein
VNTSVTRILRKTYLINYLVVGLVAATMFLPFLWMVLTSFKMRGEILSIPPSFFPKVWTFENYIDAANRLNVVRIYWNTTLVTVTKTFIQIYFSAILGFVFGKYDFKYKEIVFYFILATMILPFEVYMIPLYRMMVAAKWGDSYTALIVPMMFSAYSTFLLRQFMFTIPNDLLDAARIDGAGEWFIFHRLIIPLCKPVLATLVSFYFMWNWNDFLWPLIVISSKEKMMLPVALSGFVAEHGTDYGLIMAGAVMATLPVVIVFVVFQRYVVQGISLTGLK